MGWLIPNRANDALSDRYWIAMGSTSNNRASPGVGSRRRFTEIGLFGLDRVCVLSSQFLTAWLVIRTIPAVAGDHLLAALALMGAIHTTFAFSLEPATVPRLVKEGAGRFLSDAVPAIAVIGSVVALVLALTTAISTGSETWASITLLCLLGPMAAFSVGETYLKIAGLPGPILAVRAFFLAIGGALKLIAGFSLRNPELLVAAHVFESLHLVAIWFIAKRVAPPGGERANFQVIVRQLLPLFASGLLVFVFFRVAFIVGASLGGVGTVAAFTIGFYVYQASGMVSGVLTSAGSRRLYAADFVPPQVPAGYRQALSAWTLLGYAVFAGAAVFGPLAGPIVFGNKYGPAHWTVLLIAAASIITMNAAARSLYVARAGATSVPLVSAILGLMVQVPLAVILAPLAGSVGLAIAFLIGTFCSGILSSQLFPATRHFGLLQLKALILPWGSTRLTK